MPNAYQTKIEELTARNTTQETKNKLRELILYISDRCMNDEMYGAIKLNKILLAADVVSYLRFGQSITGAQYMKLHAGPAPVAMLPVLEDMKALGEIAIKEKQYFSKPQKRVIPLRDANLQIFTGRDIAILEEVIEGCKDLNATALSNWSHGIAWRTAKDKEIIPYQAFYIAEDQELTEEDVYRGLALIKQYGWEEYG
jgi:hypothetical protein